MKKLITTEPSTAEKLFMQGLAEAGGTKTEPPNAPKKKPVRRSRTTTGEVVTLSKKEQTRKGYPFVSALFSVLLIWR